MEKERPPWLQPLLKRFFSAENSLAFLTSIVHRHDIVRLPVLRANYLINDPEAIYYILLTNNSNYTKEGTSYERIEQVVGKGLLTASGEEWRERRKKYQPKFLSKPLKEYVPTIHFYTERMLKQWQQKTEATLNITEEMLSLVMNISSQAFIGLDIANRSLEMVRLIHILNDYAVRSISLWKWLPTPRNIRYQIARKLLDNFLLETMRQEHAPKCLLSDLYLKNANGNYLLTTSDILGEVKNFFVAGHETTGNAIGWTLYNLVKNRYVLVQVIKEIDNVLGTTTPDFDNIEKLTFLDMVIQESLRLYPTIWIFTRKAIEEDIILKYKIPAGSIINIVPYLIHRHPKYWHQPDIFYPERFLPDLSKTRPKCAYIPFGFGPRVCIGRQFALLNMKIIITLILQRFELDLIKKDYVAKPLPLITLKPEKGIWLRVKTKA